MAPCHLGEIVSLKVLLALVAQGCGAAVFSWSHALQTCFRAMCNFKHQNRQLFRTSASDPRQTFGILHGLGRAIPSTCVNTPYGPRSCSRVALVYCAGLGSSRRSQIGGAKP